jgi:hypothetical protein
MSSVPHSVKNSLLIAFRYLLKPLVRLATKNGVSFPDFSTVLKQAYVDVAVAKVKVPGQEVSEQEVSSMINVPIGDVQKLLRADGADDIFDTTDVSKTLPRLLHAWHTDPQYTGPYGVLKDLEFTKAMQTTAGGVPNFGTLAATYGPGISPDMLLEELIAAKCVQPVGSNYYRAVTRSYIPDPLSVGSIRLFARLVHNLCEAAEVNLRVESGSGKGLMQRDVYTRFGLTVDDLKAFDGYIRLRGQAFADDIDDWLTLRDRENDQKVIKTGISLFHFIVNDEDEAELSRLLN